MIENINLANEVEILSVERGIDVDVIYSILEEVVLIACKNKFKTLDFDVKIQKRDQGFYICAIYVCIEAKFKYPVSMRDPFKFFIKRYVNDNSLSLLKKNVTVSSFNRIEISKSKDFLGKKLLVAERRVLNKNFYFFVDKTMMGVVKKVTSSYLIVNIESDISGVLERIELLPNESYDVGDKIKVYAKHVIYDHCSQLLYLSRKCNELFLDLLKLEIPEINNSVINIKNIVRRPGFRSKVAVISGLIPDPVSICLGPFGLRVKNISMMLNNEIVDFVLWDKDTTRFIFNSFRKEDIDSIELNYNEHTANVFVNEKNISHMVGENGDNIKLLNRLLGWKINIFSAE